MMRVKIQAGVNKYSDLNYYLCKDVDEIYCGIDGIPSHCYRLKTFSLPEVEKVISLAKQNNKTVYFTINENISKEFDSAVAVIKKLINLKADGIIIRDIGLLKHLKEKRIKTKYILSSLALLFNNDALRFYKDLGVSRIVIPEQITPDEAKTLIKNPYGIESEVFITAREYCVVLNGFCYLSRFSEECICRKGFVKGDGTFFFMPKPTTKQHFENLYKIVKMGTRVIKVGRHPQSAYAKALLSEAILIKYLFLNNNVTLESFVRDALEIDSKIWSNFHKWRKQHI